MAKFNKISCLTQNQQLFKLISHTVNKNSKKFWQTFFKMQSELKLLAQKAKREWEKKKKDHTVSKMLCFSEEVVFLTGQNV